MMYHHYSDHPQHDVIAFNAERDVTLDHDPADRSQLGCVISFNPLPHSKIAHLHRIDCCLIPLCEENMKL